MNAYFHQLNQLPYTAQLRLMKKQAELENIPILKEEGLAFLLGLASWSGAKSVLEIGTAIGYTTIFLARAGLSVTSIERDPRLAKRARENISASGVTAQLIEGDALEVDLACLPDAIDLLFIDAAKAQNQKIFARFSPLVSAHGLIVTDNVDFHGYAEKIVFPDELLLSRDLRELSHKVSAYNDYLRQLTDWQTTFIPLGDGMAVSRRVS